MWYLSLKASLLLHALFYLLAAITFLIAVAGMAAPVFSVSLWMKLFSEERC